jgi:hypothetical protein
MSDPNSDALPLGDTPFSNKKGFMSLLGRFFFIYPISFNTEELPGHEVATQIFTEQGATPDT